MSEANHFSTSFSSLSVGTTFLLSLSSFYSFLGSTMAFLSSFWCFSFWDGKTFFNLTTLTFPANPFYFSTNDEAVAAASFFSVKEEDSSFSWSSSSFITIGFSFSFLEDYCCVKLRSKSKSIAPAVGFYTFY